MLSDYCEFFLTVLWQEVERIERVCEISFLDVLFWDTLGGGGIRPLELFN